MTEISEARMIKMTIEMRHTDREGLLHMILVQDDQITKLEVACSSCYDAQQRGEDRITELKALTDWVCIHCHQRNIGGTQCCPDWDGTTVNSRITELEVEVKQLVSFLTADDASAVMMNRITDLTAQLEAAEDFIESICYKQRYLAATGEGDE